MSIRFALIGSALLLIGCGTGTKPGEGTAPAGVRQVTIHVEGAAARLGIA